MSEKTRAWRDGGLDPECGPVILIMAAVAPPDRVYMHSELDPHWSARIPMAHVCKVTST